MNKAHTGFGSPSPDSYERSGKVRITVIASRVSPAHNINRFLQPEKIENHRMAGAGVGTVGFG